MEKNEGVHIGIRHSVSAAWGHLKNCNGELGDRKMPVMLSGKIYRTVAWPALLYGAWTWSTTKSQEKRLVVNEMRMLRWMSGVTKKDKFRNAHAIGPVKVAPVTTKITKKA